MTHKTTLTHTDKLLEIMSALRAPEGCPWDAEQTPESLAPYIIEEACELVDAIEANHLDHIKDELGDLLLQVVFVAQIFSERGQFNFEDVSQTISDKLLRRHPHVFDDQWSNVCRTELDRQWEIIKSKEPAGDRKKCISDHLPSRLPALQYAQKLISKAHKTARDNELPTGSHHLPDDLSLSEMAEADITEELIGPLLFSIVEIAHKNGVDAESALRKTTRQIVKKMDD